jgi:hypothetical protein
MVRTFCPECESELIVPVEELHKLARCCKCNKEILLQRLKKCEYCAEIIKKNAKICKFCGMRLSATTPEESPGFSRSPSDELKANRVTGKPKTTSSLKVEQQDFNLKILKFIGMINAHILCVLFFLQLLLPIENLVYWNDMSSGEQKSAVLKWVLSIIVFFCYYFAARVFWLDFKKKKSPQEFVWIIVIILGILPWGYFLVKILPKNKPVTPPVSNVISRLPY